MLRRRSVTVLSVVSVMTVAPVSVAAAAREAPPISPVEPALARPEPPLKPPARGVTFDAWLEPSRITLGEPVILRFRFTNHGRAPVALNLADEDGWLGLTVTDGAGRPLAPHVSPTFPRAGARPATMPEVTPFVRPGESFEDCAVLNGRCSLVSPGEYSVRLDVFVRFGRGRQAVAGAVSDRRTLTLTVLPEEPERLRSRAGELVRRAGAGATARERGLAVDALFTLPAGEALPFWRTLARDTPRADTAIHAIDRITRLNDAAAVDLLTAAWDSPRQPASVRAQARTALLSLWWNGGAPVRQRVEAAFVAREGKMPAVWTPPILE